MNDDWQSRGACNGADPGTFFPPKHLANAAAAEARAICARCPVIDECRDYAIEHEPLGIWAGLSPRERQALRVEHGITLRTPGRIQVNPIDDLDDGSRTAAEIAEALGLTIGAIDKHRHRHRVAA